jgi:hypothetical protein
MIDRCWSRTEILRCSCSLIVGSCVWKPGDKHARPTSCITKLSLPVNGVTESRELTAGGADVVLVFKSSFRGRCLELLCRDGDGGGSFLTTGFEFRDLYAIG